VHKLLTSLRCFDEKVELMGSEQSFMITQLRIIFESCDPSWYKGICKTKSQINEWVKDKQIITLANEQSFQYANYTNPVLENSFLSRY